MGKKKQSYASIEDDMAEMLHLGYEVRLLIDRLKNKRRKDWSARPESLVSVYLEGQRRSGPRRLTKRKCVTLRLTVSKAFHSP